MRYFKTRRFCPLCFLLCTHLEATVEHPLYTVLSKKLYSVLLLDNGVWSFVPRIGLPRPAEFYILHSECIQQLRDSCIGSGQTAPTTEEIGRLSTLFQNSGWKNEFELSLAKARPKDAFMFSLSNGMADRLLPKLGALPDELRLMIWDLAWTPRIQIPSVIWGVSQANLQSLRSINWEEKFVQLKCTEPIYVTQVNFGSVSYIAKCSNKPHHENQKPICILPTIRKIIVELDDIGLRSIDFFEFNTLPEFARFSDCSWFRTFSLPDDKPVHSLSLSVQGIVRSIEISNGFYNLWWNTNSPPDLLVENCVSLKVAERGSWSLNSRPDVTRHQHLKYLPLDQRVTGMSVGYSTWNSDRMAIYIHYSDKESRMYAEAELDIAKVFLWNYFPIHPGERIVGIWVRKDAWYYRYIAICTSTGRYHTFSPYELEDLHQRYEFQSLHGDTLRPLSGLVVDSAGLDTAHLGVKIAAFVDPLAKPTPLTIMPHFSVTLGKINCPMWHFTTASFYKPEFVQTCSVVKEGKRQYLGMQICSEGVCEVLGQWRFDMDISKRIMAPVAISFQQPQGLCMRDLCIYTEMPKLPLAHADEPITFHQFGDQTINWWFDANGSILEIGFGARSPVEWLPKY